MEQSDLCKRCFEPRVVQDAYTQVFYAPEDLDRVKILSGHYCVNCQSKIGGSILLSITGEPLGVSLKSNDYSVTSVDLDAMKVKLTLKVSPVGWNGFGSGHYVDKSIF